MKRKSIFTILILSIMMCAVLTSCSLSGELVDANNYKEQGYFRVYLYYNGGTLSESGYKEVYINQNSKLPLPGESGNPIENPTKPGNTFLGWYQINANMFDSYQQPQYKEERDASGNLVPVLDSKQRHVHKTIFYVKGHDFYQEGQTLLTLADYEDNIQYQGEEIFITKWNFEFDRVEEDIVLIALWQSTREYVFLTEEHKFIDPNYNMDDFDPLTQKDIISYLTTYTKTVSKDGSILQPDTSSSMVPEKENYQVEGLYLDYSFLSPVPFTNGRYFPKEEYNEDGSPKRVPIYIKWLSDKYEIVEGLGNFYNEGGVYTFRSRSKDSLYFKSHIDFDGATLSFPNLSTEIKGNGFTVSNFVVKVSEPRSGREIQSVFFNNIERTASITDINFRNFSVQFLRSGQTSSEPATQIINLFAKDGLDSGCTISNVNISNVTAFYDVPQYEFEMATYTDISTSTPALLRINGKQASFYKEYDITNEHASISIRQLGDKFGASSVTVTNSGAPDQIDVQEYSFEASCEISVSQSIIESGFSIPTLPNVVTNTGTYIHAGWYDENGNSLADLIANNTVPTGATVFKAAWLFS